MTITRADYKAVKHMNREQMSEYLTRIYQRGFDAGTNSVLAHIRPKPEAEEVVAGEEEPHE